MTSFESPPAYHPSLHLQSEPQPPGGYVHQPPGGYGRQPRQHPTVVVTQPQRVTPVVQQTMNFGQQSMAITCPTCHKQVMTSTKRNCCSPMPWMWCGVICLIGLFVGFLWLGCCLIPFCIPDLYEVEHTCPNCETMVGKSRR